MTKNERALRKALLVAVRAMKKSLTHKAYKDEMALFTATEYACSVLGIKAANVEEREPATFDYECPNCRGDGVCPNCHNTGRVTGG